MAEMFVENRFKYGRSDQFDDIDANDLADFLAGKQSGSNLAQPVEQREVDEDVFSAARDSARKYGG